MLSQASEGRLGFRTGALIDDSSTLDERSTLVEGRVDRYTQSRSSSPSHRPLTKRSVPAEALGLPRELIPHLLEQRLSELLSELLEGSHLASPQVVAAVLRVV